MGGYQTPEKYGIGSAHPPLTDRQRVHSGRRERWLSTKEPDAATKAVAIGNNTGNDHDLQQKDPVSIAQGLQEQHKKRFSKQNKPCIPGHEDDDQYFFESPKYILYAMRTYCLSKPIQKFKALFMQYDENSDGSLDTEEIHNGILRMGFDVPLETAVEVMNMIDLDGSASLDFAEFRCAILNERIAQDFEDHTRRMHNDCKLQDAYIERCGEAPYSASKVGPASELSLSEGHWKALNHGKKGMTVKQLTMMDLEEKRKKLHAELARARALDAAKHGAKQSKEHSDFVRNMEQNFKNLRAAFAKMDKDGSGSLDKDEMAAVCVQLNIPESWTEILISEADKDGDGEISYTEFVKALERKSALGLEAHEADKITGVDEKEGTIDEPMLPSLLGNFNYREGESLPPPLRPAGVNFQHNDKQGKLFSAHASHLSRTVSQVLEDGIIVCCVRPHSYNVKAKAPNFLK